jgi:hypothetical protein
MDLFNVFHTKLDEENGENFGEAFLEVLIARQRFQTIVEGKAYFYVNLLQTLMTNPELKAKFMRMKRAPFLPAKLTKIQGSSLDRQSPLGLFLRMSILGQNPGPFFQ